ncbi:hypothetical protein [Lapillicoccus jejuensis]|uniref:Uncharacterized protein n=1 Tax=Lapillicoccus jejuensis TaxID=402171 RepID=A0A542E2U7_9MICO|nr:hypothetical protein [Lapillicoccus jejuensis]TQJ09564.1 hypothetical protein FB458_2676 [Lapillicoccus jejuensis]
MRWERLFEDLEAVVREQERQELEAEVADRTRRERALLGLQERLTACYGTGVEVELRVAGVGVLRGPVTDVGADWVLVQEHPDHPVLVAYPAVRALVLPAARLAPTGAVARAFALGAALRAVSRDRSVVDVVDVDGHRVTGTVDAVGRDVLDLAEHPADLPRRSANVRTVLTIPFAAVAAVRRR